MMEDCGFYQIMKSGIQVNQAKCELCLTAVQNLVEYALIINSCLVMT